MLFKILGGVNNYVTSVTFTYFMLFLKFHRSILVTHNGKSPPLLLAHAKIVVFINKDDEIKHASYCSSVVRKYFISKLRADIGVTNRIFNITIEHIRMSSEKKSGRELFELNFKCIVHVNITH